MEMLIVVTLIGLMVGVSFPSVSSGVDTLRLSSGADSVASFLNAALNRAERRQQVVEVTVSKAENKLTMRSTEKGFLRELTMPAGVTVESDQRVFLYPGGTVPRIAVELANKRGMRRLVRVDPMTGVPEIETLQEAAR
ncbi:MAG: hypothetical protein HY820_16655 [Acidobacteria bacterium]|nr:hypothetical protein [Acidobacteriota bacterium]